MTPGAYKRGGAGQVIRYTTAASALGRVLVAATERGVCAVQLGDSDGALERGPSPRLPARRAAARRDGPASHPGRHPRPPRRRGPGPRPAPGRRPAPTSRGGCGTPSRTSRHGETRSYAQVAQAVGQPRAVRAVARACASNRVALLIPCHRVVRSDGSSGGYRWGVGRKQRLLAGERAPERGPEPPVAAADLGRAPVADRLAAGRGGPGREALRPSRPPAHGPGVRRARRPLRRRRALPQHGGHGAAPIRRGRVQVLRSSAAAARGGPARVGLRAPRAPRQPLGRGARTDRPLPARGCPTSSPGVRPRARRGRLPFSSATRREATTPCTRTSTERWPFPCSSRVFLSRPGRDYEGGAFLLVEQRPRAQSIGEALVAGQGEAIVFANRYRPVRSSRGVYRASVRHGVSRVAPRAPLHAGRDLPRRPLTKSC